MIRLFYNYYQDKNQTRQKEIDMCLQKNLDNKALSIIILESDTKPSYNYLFDKINSLTGPDDVNIISNSDIFFDETIELVNKIKHTEAYALSRYDWYAQNSIVFFDKPDSQDVWIVRGPTKKVYGDFTLGTRGCDNRIAHELKMAGYVLSNPSHSIKTYHVHNSGIRNYTMSDLVPPPHLTVPTCWLPK